MFDVRTSREAANEIEGRVGYRCVVVLGRFRSMASATKASTRTRDFAIRKLGK